MERTSLASRMRMGDHIRRVGIVFSGGPAPAANAVISAAAVSFLDDGRQVVGFLDGYKALQEYHPVTSRLQLHEHFHQFSSKDVTGYRNTQGIVLRTSRANPGRGITCPADLDDRSKTKGLRNVYSALHDMKIDALISIGGNLLYEYQKRLPREARKIQVVHLPKTIDNDYEGIDFTFGYFTAVDFLAKEIKNLRADAEAGSAYYIVECMGRKAGWLSYGVGIAGEANMVFSVEDVSDEMTFDDEVIDPETGKTHKERRMRIESLVDQIVNLILISESREHKYFGTVVLAEGLAEMFPERYIRDIPKDEHGNISIGRINIGREITKLVRTEYKRQTGREKKVIGLQLGYESRCARPQERYSHDHLQPGRPLLPDVPPSV